MAHQYSSMNKDHYYRMTDAYVDNLMTLSGDQLITIIAELTDRTIAVVSSLYDDGAIPKETQKIFGVEKYDPGHWNTSKTHLLGSITDLGDGVKEGRCSDECWCKE